MILFEKIVGGDRKLGRRSASVVGDCHAPLATNSCRRRKNILSGPGARLDIGPDRVFFGFSGVGWGS